jgi:hypothetical protein
MSNVTLFSFLADFLDNRFLMKKCIKANLEHPQQFKLSSKQLICFPKSWLNHLADFNLIVNTQTLELIFLFSLVYVINLNKKIN